MYCQKCNTVLLNNSKEYPAILLYSTYPLLVWTFFLSIPPLLVPFGKLDLC